MAKTPSMATGPGLHGGPAATQMLRDDHKRILGLFEQCRNSRLRAREVRECGCEELFEAIDQHYRLVDEVFYPALQKALAACGPEVHPGMGLLGQIRDRDVELIARMRELRRMDVDSAEFPGRLSELGDLCRVHMEEEERELVCLAEEIMPIEEMGALGMRLQMKREELRARGGPHRRDVA